AALARPAVTISDELQQVVTEIIADVELNGDEALLEYARKFDKRTQPRLLVSAEVIQSSEDAISPELKQAIDQAYSNIRAFHALQVPTEKRLETQP
ncbi:histidinol dehydrogenase, partial [Pseudoalteromonas ruthenica]